MTQDIFEKRLASIAFFQHQRNCLLNIALLKDIYSLAVRCLYGKKKVNLSLFLKSTRVALQQHTSPIFNFNDDTTFTENEMVRTTISKAFRSIEIKSCSSLYKSISNSISLWAKPNEFNTKDAYFYIEKTNENIIAFMTDVNFDNVWSGQVCVIKKPLNGGNCEILDGRIYADVNNKSVPIELKAFDHNKRNKLMIKNENKMELAKLKSETKAVSMQALEESLNEDSKRGARKHMAIAADEIAQLKHQIELLQKKNHDLTKKISYRDEKIAKQGLSIKDLQKEIYNAKRREKTRDEKISNQTEQIKDLQKEIYDIKQREQVRDEKISEMNDLICKLKFSEDSAPKVTTATKTETELPWSNATDIELDIWKEWKTHYLLHKQVGNKNVYIKRFLSGHREEFIETLISSFETPIVTENLLANLK